MTLRASLKVLQNHNSAQPSGMYSRRSGWNRIRSSLSHLLHCTLHCWRQSRTCALLMVKEGARRVSNPQPPEPQSGALPLSYGHHNTEEYSIPGRGRQLPNPLRVRRKVLQRVVGCEQQSPPTGATKMSDPISEQTWHLMTEDILSGMREWRAQHPKATLREMEDELDARWARVRARMLEDMALASSAA